MDDPQNESIQHSHSLQSSLFQQIPQFLSGRGHSGDSGCIVSQRLFDDSYKSFCQESSPSAQLMEISQNQMLLQVDTSTVVELQKLQKTEVPSQMERNLNSGNIEIKGLLNIQVGSFGYSEGPSSLKSPTSWRQKQGTSRAGQNNSNRVKQLEDFQHAMNEIDLRQQRETGLTRVQEAISIIQKDFSKSQNRSKLVENAVSQFVRKIKQLSQNKRLPSTGRNRSTLLSYIDDIAFIEEEEVEACGSSSTMTLFAQIQEMFCLSKCLEYVRRRIRWLSEQIRVINPSQTAFAMWESFMIVFILAFSFIFSIYLFFYRSSVMKALETTAFFVFLIDILVNFNTAYYEKDRIVVNRKAIAQRYLASFFMTDVISTAVLFYVFVNQTSLICGKDDSLVLFARSSLAFLKLSSVKKKKMHIEDVFTLDDDQQLILRLVSLVVLTFTTAHAVAIAWFMLAEQEQKMGIAQTWLTMLKIDEAEFFTKYIYSAYWSITTMCTIGYGDITPANEYEAMFASFSMMFLTCIFAYSINNIGMILQEIEKTTHVLREEIGVFQRFLEKKNVSAELKSRVRHYLRFLAVEQKNRRKSMEDEIYGKLSQRLREDVTTEINKTMLDKCRLFGMFSQQTRDAILFEMEEVIISPNEILFRQNVLDDSAIYFVQEGGVEVYHESSSKVEAIVIVKHGYFGEISFFSGSVRTMAARSVNLSSLYKITRKRVLKILKQHHSKDDFERFMMIADKINLEGDISQLQIACAACKQSCHLLRDCPSVHQKFDRQFIALKRIYSVEQQRQIVTRNIKPYFYPRLMVEENKNDRLKLLKNFYLNNIAITTNINFTQSEIGNSVTNKVNSIDRIQSEEDEEGVLNHGNRHSSSSDHSSCSLSQKIKVAELKENNQKVIKDKTRNRREKIGRQSNSLDEKTNNIAESCSGGDANEQSRKTRKIKNSLSCTIIQQQIGCQQLQPTKKKSSRQFKQEEIQEESNLPYYFWTKDEGKEGGEGGGDSHHLSSRKLSITEITKIQGQKRRRQFFALSPYLKNLRDTLKDLNDQDNDDREEEKEKISNLLSQNQFFPDENDNLNRLSKDQLQQINSQDILQYPQIDTVALFAQFQQQQQLQQQQYTRCRSNNMSNSHIMRLLNRSVGMSAQKKQETQIMMEKMHLFRVYNPHNNFNRILDQMRNDRAKANLQKRATNQGGKRRKIHSAKERISNSQFRPTPKNQNEQFENFQQTVRALIIPSTYDNSPHNSYTENA